MIETCIYFLLRSFPRGAFQWFFRGQGRAGILQRPRGRSGEWREGLLSDFLAGWEAPNQNSQVASSRQGLGWKEWDPRIKPLFELVMFCGGWVGAEACPSTGGSTARVAGLRIAPFVSEGPGAQQAKQGEGSISSLHTPRYTHSFISVT